MKTKLVLLKYPKMIEYYEEAEFQEIILYCGCFVLKNEGKRKVIDLHYTGEKSRTRTKKKPIMLETNFDDLLRIAKENNIPFLIA